MGIQQGYNFQRIYEDYLIWFHDKARSSAVSKSEEDFLQYQSGNEDVYEDAGILINRMFFFIPLLPSESKSGHLEIFRFSELNLMKKCEESDDAEEIISVEYTKYSD